MRDTSIAFALGCFHFGIMKIDYIVTSGTDYIRYLKNALESIPNLSGIEIITSEEFDKLKIDTITSIRDGSSFFPPPSFDLEIHFDLFIPKRLQDELHKHAYDDLLTEKFRIHMLDSYNFPVTFIELVDGNPNSIPSTSVIIIREFLEQQFEEKKFENIQFSFLGPSPFHADFFLHEHHKETSRINFDENGFFVDYSPQQGYDIFNIYYSNSRYHNITEAKESLFFELSSDAGSFYNIVHINLLQIVEWENLQEHINLLINLSKQSGLKALWYKVFHLSRQVQEIVIALSQFESNRIWSAFSIKRDYQQLNYSGNKSYLDKFIQEQISEFPDYPVQQIKVILDLLENRRIRSVDNLTVILAALLGGIVGTIITLLISPH